MQAEADLLRHRVLVIDDNPAIHADYRKILTSEGHTQQSAAEAGLFRSEERRVGEEGRSRGAPHHLKKKKKVERVWYSFRSLQEQTETRTPSPVAPWPS